MNKLPVILSLGLLAVALFAMLVEPYLLDTMDGWIGLETILGMALFGALALGFGWLVLSGVRQGTEEPEKARAAFAEAPLGNTLLWVAVCALLGFFAWVLGASVGILPDRTWWGPGLLIGAGVLASLANYLRNRGW